MINYDSVISQLLDAGLVLDSGIVADGVIKRCRTDEDRDKRGWYCLHEWQSSKGNIYIVGSYGIWHGNDNSARKIELDNNHQVSKAEQDAIRRRINDDKKRAATARAATHKRAALRASMVWHKSMPKPPADVAVDYLDRKGIASYGLKYSASGALVIPIMDSQRNVHGLQFILPSNHERRKKTGRDKEYWPKGMAKQGHFFLIGSPMSGICLVVEGYATGATLHAATGLPVAVAFDANNLNPVAQAIKSAYKNARLLICADDDYLQKCKACSQKTVVSEVICQHCGEEHGQINPGIEAASVAAVDVGGSWVIPEFPAGREGQKLTDFNDLQHFPGAGLHSVARIIEEKVSALGWSATASLMPRVIEGGGDVVDTMPSRLTVDEAVMRIWGTYGLGGKVLFDEIERRLVHKDDVINLLPRHGWDDLKNHPSWRVARDTEIGFDPTESDKEIRCNLYGGWKMEPKPGQCSALLELLAYLCNNEENGQQIYEWVLKWLAYPLQNRGAKMHSSIVVHGPQGTGKSRFFEAIVSIYGEYARVLGQEALEDKFNADWAEKKLFILADEVLARADMYHVKNRLKGFITGEVIRVNPKNVAAHTEKNQMNIVFLSNEHMPTVLENDDRRHCVIWVPPKLPDSFFEEVNLEIDNGGIEALFQHLLDIDLGDFKPWTKPPMTDAKQDLINLGVSSNERFIQEWQRLEIDDSDGNPMPFCPCTGSQLYKLYERWCRINGEIRPRPSNHFIGHLAKLHGWCAGKSQRTYITLHPDNVNGGRYKNRKIVIPSEHAMSESLKLEHGEVRGQQELIKKPDENKAMWLTRGHFAFENAMGWNE